MFDSLQDSYVICQDVETEVYSSLIKLNQNKMVYREKFPERIQGWAFHSLETPSSDMF